MSVGKICGNLASRNSSNLFCLLSAICCVLLSGCGYTTRPGLAPHLKTIYVQPFTNRIDFTQVTTSVESLPLYRHGMEVTLTSAIIDRFQFTGLLRPASRERANCRLEGEVISFRRDALRYNASQQIEEWRLNLVVNVRFWDQTNNTLLWQEESLTGDTTYFALGSQAESEATALNRAITDLARRIVERSVENW